jgi:hypothetical protein
VLREGSSPCLDSANPGTQLAVQVAKDTQPDKQPWPRDFQGEPGIMAHACNLSYMGGIGRRIMV